MGKKKRKDKGQKKRRDKAKKKTKKGKGKGRAFDLVDVPGVSSDSGLSSVDGVELPFCSDFTVLNKAENPRDVGLTVKIGAIPRSRIFSFRERTPSKKNKNSTFTKEYTISKEKIERFVRKYHRSFHVMRHNVGCRLDHSTRFYVVLVRTNDQNDDVFDNATIGLVRNNWSMLIVSSADKDPQCAGVTWWASTFENQVLQSRDWLNKGTTGVVHTRTIKLQALRSSSQGCASSSSYEYCYSSRVSSFESEFVS